MSLETIQSVPRCKADVRLFGIIGLGKTIQVIAFFSLLKQQGKSGPHLIVVP